MTITTPSNVAGSPPVWRRWPLWAPRVAAAWGVLYAIVQFCWAATSTPLRFGTEALPRTAQWCLAALALAASAAALASGRALGSSGQTAVTVALTTATLGFALGTFGAPIEFVSLVGGVVGNSVSLVHLALSIAGTGLLAATTLAHRRRVRGRCPRCGEAHAGPIDGPLSHPAPSRASVATRVVVYVGMSGILPWATAKTIWTFGGDALGITSRQWKETSNANGSAVSRALESVGIDFTVAFAMLAWFLMLGLVYRWGQRFPRWTLVLAGRRVPRLLPLIPAWLTGITLSLYGVGLIGLGLTQLAQGRTEVYGTLSPWMVVFGGLAFGGLGLGLIAGACSYAPRTRPTCAAAAAK